MKKYFLITFFVLLGSQNLYAGTQSPMYAFSVDSQNRPITGCLEIDSHSLSSIIISMNCKKTAVPHIYICSQGRLVQYYKTQKDCQAARDDLSKLHGEHTLATDPHENR